MSIKILHLAAFNGNIGDNASHIGLESILSNVLERPYEIKRNEIRRYYKNINPLARNFFDSSFVTYANQFDFIIIGGGGFLDYFVTDSATGTTIDISIELLEKIRTPILFSSVGCVPNNSIPEGNEEKFQMFLDYILTSKNIDLLLRNDGSEDNLNLNFKLGLNQVETVLDNGFYFSTNFDAFQGFKKKYVAMSISFDQINMTGPGSIELNEDIFYEEYAKTIKYIVKNFNLDVILIPHVYTDLISINRVLSILDDQLVRNSIIIAPCIQGDYGAHYNFSIYKNSELIVGTRFHANVCGIAMGINTIGLSILNRVEFMYTSLGMKYSYLKGNDRYSNKLCKKINESLLLGKKECQKNTMLNDLKNESIAKHKNSINMLLN